VQNLYFYFYKKKQKNYLLVKQVCLLVVYMD